VTHIGVSYSCKARLQICVESPVNAQSMASFLVRAHEATGGALPEKCTMDARSIRTGSFGATADIRSIFGVDSTCLFFAPPEKHKAHMKTHTKCVAYAPVLHAVDANTMTLTQTDGSEGDMINGTQRTMSRYLNGQTQYRCGIANGCACACHIDACSRQLCSTVSCGTFCLPVLPAHVHGRRSGNAISSSEGLLAQMHKHGAD
jgi:hypothetical protein